MKTITGTKINTSAGIMIIPDEQGGCYKVGERVLFDGVEYCIENVVSPSKPHAKWSLEVRERDLENAPYDFYKINEEDSIWWADTPGVIGLYLFSFDRKIVFNLFRDYPCKLSAEQKRIFDEENPFWQRFFRNRKPE